ncbi:GTP pyrophosphokinase [Chloropicon primus]|uniref:GTP diphosphokinase n=2 Tax=Chloropicon primus TaxID=1764295 RepID=A0A5B8MK05_9CHLO|nr:GTP pyrophosphokinase [Chloropicon primus]UPQ99623.1 GTP pyrophosphokinase [Chloropicon primus]|eukprot:QDZ20414.1 GTP pyrophosphokinase [Chloropicon primus]
MRVEAGGGGRALGGGWREGRCPGCARSRNGSEGRRWGAGRRGWGEGHAGGRRWGVQGRCLPASSSGGEKHGASAGRGGEASASSGKGTAQVTAPQDTDPYGIQTLWHELKKSISYLSAEELQQCQQALQVAYGAHKGQKRKSGEPYIIHPVAVACILGELNMDSDSIVAGLLHDVVEDTDKVSFEDIQSIFGQGVRQIVEGETKVTKLRNGNREATKDDKKNIDMQQLFIAMTKDMRIIIVKLADRLHNMRTLHFMRPSKQAKIARETLTIFAPLANLLGMYKIQVELEDLSFQYSMPEEYRALSRRVKALKMEQNPVVYEARKTLLSVLEEDPFFQQIAESVEIQMTSRSLYNIHKKLKANALHLRDLQHILQLAVIVKPSAPAPGSGSGSVFGPGAVACYYLLGKIHDMWAPIPKSFKDYIANPKASGYQSIHTTVLPLGSGDLFPLEIQLRDDTMNILAEQGYAAHRRLVADQGNVAAAPSVERANGNGQGHAGGLWQAPWMNSFRNMSMWEQEFAGRVTAEEFVETVVGDFLPRTIFVFTSDGTLVSLPKGATIVDFAYQIDVGKEMLMAKVNGVPTHPSQELKLADVVEIVRHSGPPSEYMLKRQSEFLTYAKGRSTRHKIMKFLKNAPKEKASGKSSEKKEMKKEAMKNVEDDLISERYRFGEVMWLILRCEDEVGLLATVASIISSSGLGIRSYSGSSNDYSNIFFMNFELAGDAEPDKIQELCDQLYDLKAIASFAMGCNWQAPKQ